MAKLFCEQTQGPCNKILINKANNSFLSFLKLLLVSLWVLSCPAIAQNGMEQDQQLSGAPSIIAPKIERNQINTPNSNTKLLDGSAYVGLFKLEGFQTQPLTGIQMALHPLNWLFIEANYGVSQVNDDDRESVGFKSTIADEKLEILSVNLGIQVAKSQIMLNRNHPTALNANGYLSVGAGNMKISIDPQLDAQKQNTVELDTIVLGLGFKLMLNQWLIIDSTVRDHISTEAILDDESKGHNLEFRVGLGVYY